MKPIDFPVSDAGVMEYLWQEATDFVDDLDADGHMKLDHYQRAIIAKFGELIVQECAEVCKIRVGNSDYNTGRMHCASDIKEHFGVDDE